MLPPGEPKFRRRKAERPAEIVQAAMHVFAEKGFAAARLDDIAARARVSKGGLYLYFDTKEDIFRAVVEQAIAPNMQSARAMLAAHPGPFPDLVRTLAGVVGGLIQTTAIGGVAKMVIGEARNFPELARIWHDELVAHMLGAFAASVEQAQGRGEVRAGDPRAYALQLIAPLLIAVIWRETFVPVGAPGFDIPRLIDQHVETYLRGIAP
ncbi:TetR/AcrR family transcriptional regulator [Phenylobacterium sp.]|uniref:TetR/AcrR family transcriptional regulator n=1 Tax=Phenylobacterium sp. TaxID=1871053 RepID=UPI0035B2C45D